MTDYILSWYEGELKIFQLNSYEDSDEYMGIKCRVRLKSKEDAQEVIDWILRVLGTKALGRLSR